MNNTRNIFSEHPQGVRRRAPSRSAAALLQRGFSLIEMMISITIGLMIVVALVGVVASNSRSTKTNDRTSELQSNGRYALDHLRRELRHAGYRGYTEAKPNTPAITITTTNPTGSVPECGGAGSGFVQNIRQGAWGANNQNPFSTNCIPDANYDSSISSDVLVIRRVAGAPIPTADLAANTIYFRSTYFAGQAFTGAARPNINPGALAPDDNFALQVYAYYIGRDNNNVPALRRVALKGNGDDCNGTAATVAILCDEMIVSGIEQMQVQYGLATTDLRTQYYNAGDVTASASLTGTSTNTARTDWEDVNSLRIWLLARNTQPETGYSNTTSYEMGDLTGANAYNVNDSFRRQLFTSVVQLRNH